MKKITILLFIFCFNFYSFSQSKEFIILDSISKKPIDLVQVSYPNLEIGSVSNKDGRIRIPLKKGKIFVSHLNYFEKELSFTSFTKKDTLFLNPRSLELDEIVVYNLDLKKKIINILDNTYFKKYSTKKAIHNSTYKETFYVNDSLTRLFQIQLDWFSKNSLFKDIKSINKRNVLDYVSIDYSKKQQKNTEFINANSAHVTNDSFFRFLHLNYLLSILRNHTMDFEIENIKKNKNTVQVYFNASLKQNGNVIYSHKNSLLVFDKNYESITHLKFNMFYNTGFKEALSKINKIPHQKKITKHIVELSFKKLKNSKLTLSYFTSKMYGIIKSEKFSNNIVAEQNLYVNETKLGKRIKKGNIDLKKAFYESIPNNIQKGKAKFLLTNKEKEFLKD